MLTLCCSINISLGPSEDRLLITGLHTVADIYCTCCNTVLGWKYVSHLLPPPGQWLSRQTCRGATLCASLSL